MRPGDGGQGREWRHRGSSLAVLAALWPIGATVRATAEAGGSAGISGAGSGIRRTQHGIWMVSGANGL